MQRGCKLILAILILTDAALAAADCTFETQSAKGKQTVAVALTRTKAGTSFYSAKSGGFTLTAEFTPATGYLIGKVTGPQGEKFEYENKQATFLDDLDCSGGAVDQLRYWILCDSPQMREKRKQHGWTRTCSMETIN